MYYWNHRGERVIDACSGLFCCAAGHGREEIATAVQKQLMEMDYATSFQLGHPSSFELASRIAAMTPGDINRVFFANSGSEAVDTAMKIALAHFRARGEGQRVRFVSRERAFHGVNFGGTSLSGLVRNRDTYGTGLPGVVHMRHTDLPEHRFVKGQPETGADLADDLSRFVQLYGGDTIAACVVEPAAGSTGWLVPPKGYLDRLRKICDEHGILLIFDEVICGFGRTGKAFAAQTFDVVPDMITMAKAMTNGTQPMSAVAVQEEIYDTIVDNAPENSIELFHGYTYSAHPAACAAGLATQDIYEKDRLFERGRGDVALLRGRRHGPRGHPGRREHPGAGDDGGHRPRAGRAAGNPGSRRADQAVQRGPPSQDDGRLRPRSAGVDRRKEPYRRDIRRAPERPERLLRPRRRSGRREEGREWISRSGGRSRSSPAEAAASARESPASWRKKAATCCSCRRRKRT